MKKSTRNRINKKFVAYRNIIRNYIFKDFCYTGNLDETCKSIKKYRGVLLKLIDILRLDNKRHGWKNDYKTGEETYGYKDIESIENNLMYISDRFLAEFRLQWMIKLPEKVENWKNLDRL